MRRTACLTADELDAFHLGELPDSDLEEMATHLEACPHCEASARARDGLSDPVMTAFRRSAQTGPLPDPMAPITRVGSYEILGEIGRGGMGVVYRARHVQLQRIVALKMLLGGDFADGQERARFRTEAEAVARLQHPNIVQIYDVGEHEFGPGLSRPYFTLELVDGGNLSVRLAGRPQPPRQAAAWVETLARATHYAHQQGIIHRDLKPSNVLLTADGQPKICDFGVAKLLSGSDVKTISGMLLGTAEYMAPEQATGDATVGPPADVYALGAILYTTLTARPPFQGTSALHTLQQVRDQEPLPPRRLLPQLPRDLDTICLKCLEKQPNRRYASAEELADDLHRFLADEPIKARRPTAVERCARWVRHNKAVAGAVACVIGALAAAVAVSTYAAVQARTAESKAVASQLKTKAALELAEERRELALRNLYAAKTNLTGMALDVPGGLSQVATFLSEWRGFNGKDDPRGWEWYYCQTLIGRAHLTLRGHGADASSVAWSPSGERIATGGFDDTVRIWDASTGRQRRVIPAPLGGMALSWAGDDRRLACANYLDKSVSVWDADTGQQLLVLKGHSGHVFGVAFSPDGKRLASTDDASEVIVWDAANGKPIFTGKSIPPNDTHSAGGAVCWSPDGRSLATSNFGHTVTLWDAESGNEVSRLVGHTAAIGPVRWSPDGRRIATAAQDQTVRIWNANSRKEVRVLGGLALEEFQGTLAWSPDSRRLAGGGSDLSVRVWDADSGEEQERLWGHTGSRISGVCWSPDGTRLASGERGWNGEVKIWKLNSAPQPLTFMTVNAAHYLEVCWNADGRKLATGHTDGTVRIWDSATGRPLQRLGDTTSPIRRICWSPDGSRLLSADEDSDAKLWDVDNGRLVTHLKVDGPGIARLSWSPDGRRVLVTNAAKKVILWDTANGSSRAASFTGHGAAWGPQDRVAVGESYKMLIHDAETGDLVAGWGTSSHRENEPYWNPSGTHIAIIDDYSVDVREATAGRPAFPPLRHTRPVRALAWSPDGKEIAVVTEDDQIHLWDAVSGNPILTLRGETGQIATLAWSPDGARLAFSSSQGTVTIRDATPGCEVERAPSLLRSLNYRLSEHPDDRDALRLRVGVRARLGEWDTAAADVERFEAVGKSPSGLFQAGWWIADDLESEKSADADPFSRPHSTPQETPRWYVSADDPNGYVPLFHEPTHYLTRLYATDDREMKLTLDLEKKLSARVWVNGKRIEVVEPTPVFLHRGWNIVALRIEEAVSSGNVLFRPRAGFYLRLESVQ